MNAIRRYVATISIEDCIVIHAESVEWEKTGKLADDAFLRRHTQTLVDEIGVKDIVLSIWMMGLVHEVWRRFAVCRLEKH